MHKTVESTICNIDLEDKRCTLFFCTDRRKYKTIKRQFFWNHKLDGKALGRRWAKIEVK